MSNYIENEVKLYVPDLKQVESGLLHLGAECVVPRTYERNVRYDTTDGTLSSRGVVLRLREDNGLRLTYKEPATHAGDGITSRFEAEVSISDFDTMHLILDRLGFKPYVVYEKYRTTYHYHQTEIVLDEMPYGNFVEIEGETSNIQQVIIDLSLQSATRMGSNYLAIFEHVKQVLKLEFDDLTFDNFKGVTVPFDALTQL